MKRLNRIAALAAISAAAGLFGCTTGATNISPNITFQSSNGILQLSVGTVNFQNNAFGLNVFETFRGTNGFTAVPVNTATISGPPGFIGPAGSLDPGAGLTVVPLGVTGNGFAVGPTSTDLASADGFGIGPPLSSLTSANPFPLQPQFRDAVTGAQVDFTAYRPVYGGPPAYPPPSGTNGFPEGFYLLALSNTTAPPTGTYTLTVSFSQNGVSSTVTKSATLTGTVLGPMGSPSFASDGAGGGTVMVSVPAGVKEVLMNIRDVTVGTLFSTVVMHNPGGGAATLSGTVPSGTFAVGDSLRVQAFGFDYSNFELGPPNNTSQSPPMPASADVTTSNRVAATE